jgi:acyl-CoA thioester hydrolase
LNEEPVRDNYRYALSIPTRWNDNDMHGHVNNIEYYSYFDTVVTVWLVNESGLDVRSAPVLGLCVESQCNFRAPITFPEVVDARMRVGKVGRSSVCYEIGLFIEGKEDCAATGRFVHVYVDRDTRRPVDLPEPFRAALEDVTA